MKTRLKKKKTETNSTETHLANKIINLLCKVKSLILIFFLPTKINKIILFIQKSKVQETVMPLPPRFFSQKDSGFQDMINIVMPE